MLRLEDCQIENGSFTVAADLQIAACSKLAIIGPSGAGKSTLIEAIAGFLPLRTGRILWDGQDLTDVAPGKRPVAMLFQDGNLFPHLTVAQNAGLGLGANLRLSEEEHLRVQRALLRVGLGDLALRKPAALSGGQQSRVALARVLLQQREILLLDEPFAALGPAMKMEMLDLVGGIASETGATVLMVSHDPEDARRFADAVILVAEGKAQPPEPTAELLNNPPPELKAYLG